MNATKVGEKMQISARVRFRLRQMTLSRFGKIRTGKGGKKFEF